MGTSGFKTIDFLRDCDFNNLPLREKIIKCIDILDTSSIEDDLIIDKNTMVAPDVRKSFDVMCHDYPHFKMILRKIKDANKKVVQMRKSGQLSGSDYNINTLTTNTIDIVYNNILEVVRENKFSSLLDNTSTQV